ncbi:OLC1v1010962C1 [Oldenlandia corymbosa var. corymbosa]|uniref:OLC1v1010962C1 n=1 Tax=Oldenlandia corymbosa var. corymbosa TaxID=529605 RepID=A0AAV1DSM2_OLDCO|nr:OLC1v1010962C1 [Oldenlandia corymbosa var. corymbosa]
MDHPSVWATPFPLHYHPPRYRCSRVSLPGVDNVPQLMRYPIPKPITRFAPSVNPFRSDQSRTFRAAFSSTGNVSCAVEISMAGDAEKKDEKPHPVVNGGGQSSSVLIDKKEEGDKESEKSTPKNIPPPPEKPLPDDCCGSGCVRCVWDVYYDELEEYNKLYKK